MIAKTEIANNEVVLHLNNGVKVHVTVFDDHLYLGFSGIKDTLTAGAFLNQPGIPMLEVANFLNVGYKPAKED